MEVLYGVNSGVIVGVLFLLILASNELALRYGFRQARVASEGDKSQTYAIQAAVLGLLALLLGFSFSMGLQRFDDRSNAVVREANAIGTAYLRTSLLPESEGAALRKLLRAYLELRIVVGGVDLTQEARRRELDARATTLQSDLWNLAAKSAKAVPNPATTPLVIQSLNELIDAYGVRQAAFEKHIPEVVLYLMFGAFVISGAVVGYASGLHGARPKLATFSMSFLIVLVTLLVIDLDRPHRGLIRVDQSSLSDLNGALASGAFDPRPGMP